MRFDDIGLPLGTWQLAWIGRFSARHPHVDVHRLNAFFRRDLRYAEQDQSPAIGASCDYVKASLPLPHLVYFPQLTTLHVSAVDDSITAGPSVRRIQHRTGARLGELVEMKLCFDRDNIDVVSRIPDDGELATMPASVAALLGTHRLPVSWRNDPDYSSSILLFKRERVLIPCVEIFRTLYARDSKFAQFYFDGKFSQPDRYLFNRARGAYDPDSRHAIVWLRQWVDDDQAAFVAHFEFSEFAMQRAQQILTDQVASYCAGERQFRVFPHFEGEWNVRLRIARRSDPELRDNALMAARIEACAWAPPFRTLVWDRDNDSRRRRAADLPAGSGAPGSSGSSGSGWRRDLRSARGHVASVPTVTDAGRANPALSELQLDDESFIDPLNFTGITALKLPVDERGTTTPTPFTQRVREQRMDALLTTARTRCGAKLIQPVVLNFTPDPRTGDIVEPGSLLREVDGDLLILASELARCAMVPGCDVEFLEVWPSRQYRDGVRIFALPTAVEKTRKPAWLYRDTSKSVVRLGFAARITRATATGVETRAVVDLEGMLRPDKDEPDKVAVRRNSIWVFNVDADEGKLEDAIADVIRARAIAHKQFDDIVASRHLRQGRRKHTFDALFLKNKNAVVEWLFSTVSTEVVDTSSRQEDVSANGVSHSKQSGPQFNERITPM